MAGSRLRREEYTVGWVCALPIELAAAQEMLDEEHEDLEQDENDDNLYSLGRIGGHDVVIVCLPAGLIGNNPAAAVATQMRSTFRSVRFGLMVGIGGGVPSAEADIRLGDVVVSQPHQGYGGVIQYDSGKATPRGFQRTGFLNSPPQILLSAVAKVRANCLRRRSRLSEQISKLCHLPEFTREAAGPDILFEATCNHEDGPTCQSCRSDKRVARPSRENEGTVVHYGTIASGNQVMRDATERDRVSAEFGGVLCFEMEAAGLMQSFPCLVIRGICDYADSHKNKKWQAYAAGTAAACAKEVLSVIPSMEVAKARTVDESVRALSAPSYALSRVAQSHAQISRAKKEYEATKLIEQSGNGYKHRYKISKRRICKGGGSMSREEQISRGLSKLLRHTAEYNGLLLGPGGYVNLYDVMNARSIKFLEITLPELRHLVASSEKQRFSLIPITSGPGNTTHPTAIASAIDGNDPRNFLIRANRGHNIEVDI